MWCVVRVVNQGEENHCLGDCLMILSLTNSIFGSSGWLLRDLLWLAIGLSEMRGILELRKSPERSSALGADSSETGTTKHSRDSVTTRLS